MDYELAGQKEWDLPGYGVERTLLRDTMSQPQPYTEGQPAQGGYSHPSGSNNFSSRGRGRPQMSRGRGAFQSGRGRGNASNPFFGDFPSKAKCMDGQQPDATFALPDNFGTFKHEFFNAAKAIIPGGIGSKRYEAFEAISRATGAYMKQPRYTDQAIEIWGEPAQVTSAENLLQHLISQSYSSYAKKKPEWTKVHAYSESKEADAEREEKRELRLEHLKNEPDEDCTFPEKLLFLWPSEGPSMTEAFGSELQGLDPIRRKFGYIIYVPKELPNYICAVGERHEVMRQILWRLRALWSEAMAVYSAKLKVFVVEPPESSVMKKNITVKKGSHSTKAFLQGDSLTESEVAQWVDQTKLIQITNDDRILDAVERSLQEVSFLRAHLRMRVNFGTFVLDAYRRPPGNKSSYTFEEFREMLLHEHVTGRLVPGLKVSLSEILDRCFKATDLLEPIGSTTTSSKKVDPTLSVNLEFMGMNETLLRLEAEFAKRPFTQQYEITHRRWLKAWKGGQSGGSKPPLQVVVTDFERCDWQIETKSLELHDPLSIDAALTTFSRSIGLHCTSDIGTLTGKPKRNVIFPATIPVSRIVEKTAVRYRLKGTPYILEIARYDEYTRNAVPAPPDSDQPTPNNQMSEVLSTCWGASLFDSNWDNLFGQHGNLPAGVATRYSPDLTTFFAPKKPDTEDKTAGFWRFIGLVRQVAEILGAKPTTPAPSPEKNTDKDKITLKTELPSPSKTVKFASPTEERPANLIDGDLGTLF